MKEEIETWAQWYPDKRIRGKYFIECMQLEDNNLTINFFPADNHANNHNNDITLVFENIIAYRDIDEGYRLKASHVFIEDPTEESGPWTFFKVYHSHYVKWLVGQSLGEINLTKITHFGIAGANFILDVIACSEPIVKI